MRRRTILRMFMAAALLVLAIPAATSAQFYRERYYNRDQSERADMRQLRSALAGLESSSAQLEQDLRFAPGRRVFGIFQYRTVDTNAIAQVRDFRRAVRQLRYSSENGRFLNNSVDEAQLVLQRGIELDRYLRLRSASTRVDSDLAEIRSDLHLIADAYDLRVGY